MNIAIIANDKKKELITEFCIAYCGILSAHNICATAITGKYISEATGLTIERLLSALTAAASRSHQKSLMARSIFLYFCAIPATMPNMQIPSLILLSFAINIPFRSQPTLQPPRHLFLRSTAAILTGERTSRTEKDFK